MGDSSELIEVAIKEDGVERCEEGRGRRREREEAHLREESGTADSGSVAGEGIADAGDGAIAGCVRIPDERGEGEVGGRQERAVDGRVELEERGVEEDIELVCPDVFAGGGGDVDVDGEGCALGYGSGGSRERDDSRGKGIGKQE